MDDQSEHYELNSANGFERFFLMHEMVNQMDVAILAAKCFCAHGNIACTQWNHWLDASGDPLFLDPVLLMKEDNFATDVNGILDQYRAMAVEGCHLSECAFTFENGWDPALDTSRIPVSVDVAGMGQVQLNVSGTVRVERDSSGRAVVTGSYQLSIYKAWNFDKGEYPEPHGVTLPHSFVELPKYGLARDFVLYGTSDTMDF